MVISSIKKDKNVQSANSENCVSCEFCGEKFCPRPQTRNPRACPNCQADRQKANEKEWRQRNQPIIPPPPEYFVKWRQRRRNLFEDLADSIVYCISVVAPKSGMTIDEAVLSRMLRKLFFALGIRRVKQVVNFV